MAKDVAHAVLLSGEHPSLPAAELEALLAVHAPDARVALEGLVAAVEGGPGVEDALARMALAHAWGRLWGMERDDEEGRRTMAEAVRRNADGRGAVAVVAQRRGPRAGTKAAKRTSGASSSGSGGGLVAMLGDAARSVGHSIDLARPDQRIFAWTQGERAAVGLLLGSVDRSAYERRASEHRAHFAPVGLHPRRAASLVHLARVAPGGTVYDPFCGTGGLVLEAAIQGYRVLASDRDPWMVQGTLQTLADAGPEPLEADAFVADVGEAPDMVDPVDGIVCDLPYGRASGTDREPVERLYARALEAFLRLLPEGGHAVVGVADPALVRPPPGLVERERHAEYVHKTLTRHYVIMKRTGEVGRA